MGVKREPRTISRGVLAHGPLKKRIELSLKILKRRGRWAIGRLQTVRGLSEPVHYSDMISIDIESSGTDYQKHSIASLGAVDMRSPERRFYGECRIFEGAHINAEALEVNGYTEAQLWDETKMTEGELVTKFFEWAASVEDWTFAGQNTSFDRDFVRAAIGRWNLPYAIATRTIDLHTLAYQHMVHHGRVPPFDAEKRRSALNLDAVLVYCGIPEEPEPHNALTGALCHAECISRLLYGKPLLPEFASFPMPAW